MMERGYVKLWRKSLDSAVFSDSDLWRLWSWCLMRANHKVRTVSVKTGKGNTLVTLQPGEFIFGRKAAGKALGWAATTVRDRMRVLQKMRIIAARPATHFSVISIVNWGSYQNAEDSTRQAIPPPNRHPTATDKNVKNVKNLKDQKQTPRKRVSVTGKVGRQRSREDQPLNLTAVKMYDWFAKEVINDPTERMEAIRAITALLDEGHIPDHLVDAAWDYMNRESFPREERYRKRAKKFFGREKGYAGFGRYGVFRRGNGGPLPHFDGTEDDPGNSPWGEDEPLTTLPEYEALH